MTSIGRETLGHPAEPARRKCHGEETDSAVVCTGAVGGYAGAHMAQAGEDVTFIDSWPAHVEKMQSDGLKISHIRDVPEFTVRCARCT